MRWSSTPLITRGMKIKTAMRCHFIPMKMAIIRKEKWQQIRTWGNWNSLHCWWECKLVQSFRKILCQFLEKVNVNSPYNSAIPLPHSCLPRRNENTRPHKDLHENVHRALFIIIQTWKQPKYFYSFTSCWTYKQNIVCYTCIDKCLF